MRDSCTGVQFKCLLFEENKTIWFWKDSRFGSLVNKNNLSWKDLSLLMSKSTSKPSLTSRGGPHEWGGGSLKRTKSNQMQYSYIHVLSLLQKSIMDGFNSILVLTMIAISFYVKVQSEHSWYCRHIYSSRSFVSPIFMSHLNISWAPTAAYLTICLPWIYWPRYSSRDVPYHRVPDG